MRPRINKAMLEMTQRWMSSSDRSYNIILREQRMGGADFAFLTNLSQKKKQALDELPISLFRWHYSTLKIGRGPLTDEEFSDIGNKMTIFLESCHFAIAQNIAPIVAVGCDEPGFQLFNSGSFEDRMQLLRRGGFSMGARCSLKLMSLDSSSRASLLRDTLIVILGDLRYFLRPKVVGLGMMSDYGSNIPPDSIARDMLRLRIQPKLVEQYTGLSSDSVTKIKRSLLRSIPHVQSQSGRIQIPARTLAAQPVDSLMYLAIYRLLAKDALKRTNARAVVAAYKQYEMLSSSLGFTEDERITPSNAYQLSNALKTGDISLWPCNHCKELFVRDTLKPNPCIWCGK